MGVSSQRHAAAALCPRGKDPPVPIVQEAGLDPEPVWTQRLEEKSFTSTGRPVRSQTLHWLSYPAPQNMKVFHNFQYKRWKIHDSQGVFLPSLLHSRYNFRLKMTDTLWMLVTPTYRRTYCANIRPWKWKQYFPPKRNCPQVHTILQFKDQHRHLHHHENVISGKGDAPIHLNRFYGVLKTPWGISDTE
jgi:hypothetical protein